MISVVTWNFKNFFISVTRKWSVDAEKYHIYHIRIMGHLKFSLFSVSFLHDFNHMNNLNYSIQWDWLRISVKAEFELRYVNNTGLCFSVPQGGVHIWTFFTKKRTYLDFFGSQNVHILHVLGSQKRTVPVLFVVHCKVLGVPLNR